jgi:FMN phosphatase YigB (HAD superfamily)
VSNLLEKLIYENRPIDVVLFDFGGVLAEEGWKDGFRAIAKANGRNVDDILKIASDTVYETGYILGKGSESSFWNAIREKTGIRDDDASLKEKIVSQFILRDRMIDLVKRLKSKNLIVGILSDQVDILDMLNDRFDFFKWFDHVFNSYHMGKGKRDISLFDDIASILKTPPDRILFIDDDPGNVERARQKGWSAILYTDAQSFHSEMARLLTFPSLS